MVLDSYLISVDGGGTKTVFCVYNMLNSSKEYFYTGSTNYKSIGEEAAKENLYKGFFNIYDKLNLKQGQVIGIALGLSGYDSDTDYQIYNGMLNALDINKSLVYICNDSELAFYAGGKAPGIAVICGTGSIVFGINSLGNKRRAGGWGSRISDLGSGYWIASQIIQQLLLYCDKCGPYEDVFEKIKDNYNAESYEALPLIITRLNDCEIAAAAKIVVEYAEKGDAFSAGVIDKAIEYLSMQVNSVYKMLDLKGEASVKTVFAGSIFKSRFFKKKMEERLKTDYNMENVKFSPVVTKPVDGGINILQEKLSRQ